MLVNHLLLLLWAARSITFRSEAHLCWRTNNSRGFSIIRLQVATTTTLGLSDFALVFWLLDDEQDEEVALDEGAQHVQLTATS